VPPSRSFLAQASALLVCFHKEKHMKNSFALIALLVVALIAITVISAETADARQAQAAIEAARAAQIAAAGQANTSFTQGIVIVGLIAALIGMGVFVVWLVYQLRIKPILSAMNGAPQGQAVTPGAYPARIRSVQPQALPGGDPIQQLIQLETLRMMQDLHQNARPRLPRPYAAAQIEEEDDYWPGEGG